MKVWISSYCCELFSIGRKYKPILKHDFCFLYCKMKLSYICNLNIMWWWNKVWVRLLKNDKKKKNVWWIQNFKSLRNLHLLEVGIYITIFQKIQIVQYFITKLLLCFPLLVVSIYFSIWLNCKRLTSPLSQL